jgi:hypothetical protein
MAKEIEGENSKVPPSLPLSLSLAYQDAGVFDLSAQKLSSWLQFGGVFTVVFGALFVLWLNPSVSPPPQQ